jgi:hypothetical protein
MKKKNTSPALTFAALVMAGLAFTTANVRAQELLAIDFGAAGAETGFVEQSSTNATHATAAGDLTVDLAGVQGIFNFATTGTNDIFYRDFYFKNGGTITLTLSGPAIVANTEYELSFWSYYGAQGRNTTFDPADDTTGPSLGPIAPGNDDPTGLDDERYTISGTYTSDGTGVLTIAVGGTGNRPAINGLRIVGGGGSGVASFAITEIDYASTTGMLTLTWNSSPNETYGVYYSTDMTNWESYVDDSVPADDTETTTTKTFDLNQTFPGPDGIPERVYFRVEK